MNLPSIVSLFQFQHGTIKSNPVFKGDKKLSLFQFQHGTIKSYVKFDPQDFVRMLFQFQHGTIKRSDTLVATNPYWISIPTWYD